MTTSTRKQTPFWTHMVLDFSETWWRFCPHIPYCKFFTHQGLGRYISNGIGMARVQSLSLIVSVKSYKKNSNLPGRFYSSVTKLSKCGFFYKTLCNFFTKSISQSIKYHNKINKMQVASPEIKKYVRQPFWNYTFDAGGCLLANMKTNIVAGGGGGGNNAGDFCNNSKVFGF